MMKKTEHDDAQNRSGVAALTALAQDHPLLTGALVLLMLAGSALAWLLLPEDISSFRRIVGGALLGGLSWLLVMMGRMLD